MNLGTKFTNSGTKIMLCGSGELGKEVVIELQRLGLEVIALDSYENAPAMQVADKSYVLSMLDADALRNVIEKEKPDYIVPEIEAIATDVFVEAEERGITVIPNAQAVRLTMNREGIRTLASKQLGLKTSKYRFASTKEEFIKAVQEISLQSSVDDHFLPCVVKPVMSSSGKGQSLIREESQIDEAWSKAQQEGRAGAGKVIVEEMIDFDSEITLLTVRHIGGTSFCPAIGHRQVDGDYIESWQPHPCSATVQLKAVDIAKKITSGLGGYGVFGVELFIKGDEVYFSEVSPRPHDTGLVTLISQNMSEFQLHARAILGLPIPDVELHKPSASRVIKLEGKTDNLVLNINHDCLNRPETDIRIFGKPGVNGKRRVGVLLAREETIEKAREVTKLMLDDITVDDLTIKKIT